jgi:hypothetical protein
MTDHSAMKLGKAPAVRDRRTLALADYATPGLKPAPNTCMLFAVVKDFGMMLNDRYGCCTIAGICHIIQQWTAENGNEVIIPDADVLTLYEKACGYNPADLSTDQGGVEMDVLKYWTANPINGHALQAFVFINSRKRQELKDSVYYFGSAYIGVDLPVSAQSQDVWDITSGDDAIPGSWGGHAVMVCGYDEQFVYIVTWGIVKKATWAWYLEYCDEAYALLSADWCAEATKCCPEGFALADLQADLAEVSKA